MVQLSRFFVALLCLAQLQMSIPFEAVAQDRSIDLSLPDCLEGVGGGGEGGGEAGSAYDEIIKEFAERVDQIIDDLDRRMINCFANGWGVEVPPSTEVGECQFTQAPMRKKSPWLTFESGTPIGGDSGGYIDNTRRWVSMADPITGSGFPIEGVGFGFEVKTKGFAEQSSDTLTRESAFVVYYKPLRLMVTCSTDQF